MCFAWDDYKELASDENSHELDGKALYTMGRGMKHGRVPIGDGAVDKETILVHRLSVPFKPVNPDDYERVIKENEQLKQTNQILHDENGVNRALIMVLILQLLVANNVSYTCIFIYILFNCRQCMLILEKNRLQSCCPV